MARADGSRAGVRAAPRGAVGRASRRIGLGRQREAVQVAPRGVRPAPRGEPSGHPLRRTERVPG
ncbi:hypothetical protein C0Q57_30770 [Streptomyces albidoflavus]|nr:hypothetical protein C0Q57_30770 [Streptomyces albidoflavus]